MTVRRDLVKIIGSTYAELELDCYTASSWKLLMKLKNVIYLINIPARNKPHLRMY